LVVCPAHSPSSRPCASERYHTVFVVGFPDYVFPPADHPPQLCQHISPLPSCHPLADPIYPQGIGHRFGTDLSGPYPISRTILRPRGDLGALCPFRKSISLLTGRNRSLTDFAPDHLALPVPQLTHGDAPGHCWLTLLPTLCIAPASLPSSRLPPCCFCND
jgi:hypothetical protein